MPDTWLTVLAWIALVVAFASAAWILSDIYGHGYRQKMPVMEAVWPVTALYFGPAAIWAYRRFGRPASPRWLKQHGLDGQRRGDARGRDHPPILRAPPASWHEIPATGAPRAPGRHRRGCRARRPRAR